MTEIDRRAGRAAEAIRGTLERLGNLIAVTALLAAIIGAATFATGWWVFDGSRGAWTVVGGVLCLVPVLAAVRGWIYVKGTASAVPRMAQDVQAFMKVSRESAAVLIDHDSGQAVAVTARSFSFLRQELQDRRAEFPALWVGVRAITAVPGMAAIAVLGMLAAGALGTVLLLVGLLS